MATITFYFIFLDWVERCFISARFISTQSAFALDDSGRRISLYDWHDSIRKKRKWDTFPLAFICIGWCVFTLVRNLFVYILEMKMRYVSSFSFV